MKISIKDFNVQMDIKNKGFELDVSSNDNKHLGDLYITKSQVIWCQGKTARENGIAYNWDEFIALMESESSN